MGIPTIEPYDMPEAAALPRNVASWHPDPRRALLLVHDMQRYFVDFLPDGPPRTRLLSQVARLCQHARKLEIPVVYTAQPGGMSRRERGLLHDIWGQGMRAQASHRDIVAELAPEPGDTVLPKFRYSAFHGTGLDQVIAGLGRDQLVVCGVYAHIGCLATAIDAFSRDLETFLVADAVADFCAADHRMALDYAASYCAVTLTTHALLTQLGSQV